MSDTLFRDLSKFNDISIADVIKAGERVVLFRSNDGTYRDETFTNRLRAAKAACNAGKLDCFGVYLVFEENWQQTFETFKSMVGVPHPKMFVVIDLESWGGKIRGDHSAQVEALRHAILAWLRAHRSKTAKLLDSILGRQFKRVLVYGNVGDLTTLFRHRPKGLHYIVAAYGANPAFGGKLAHQFGDTYTGDGLHAGDINSADGLSPKQFAAAVGCATLSPKQRASLLKKIAARRLRQRRHAQCKKWGFCK